MSLRLLINGFCLFAATAGHAMPVVQDAAELVGAMATQPRVCPGAVSTGGADVSSFNVGNDWRAFARSGRGFAIVKATEGLSLASARFATDWPAIKAAGLVRGAYHYFHPDRDPVAAANFYLKTVGKLGAGDLAPILDWEITAGRTKAQQIVAAQAWLDTVEAATKRVPIIYTSPSFFDALGNPAQFGRYPLYVAEYNVSCPRPPKPWITWFFWQYAQTGTVAGIPGAAVDQDLFNGSWNMLNAISK